jgi:hypothetical protein
MFKTLFLIVIMTFQYGCSSSGDKKSDDLEVAESKPDKKSVVDPVVISRLEGMGKYLRRLRHFEVDSVSNFDIVLDNDQKTEFEAKIRYKVKRPNKLFAEIKSERKHRQYFYDGAKLTIYSPKEKFYGELPFTGSLAGLVQKLNEYGIEVPLSDLFVWGTDDSKTKQITSAIYLNEEKKGSEAQDHFAIRQEKIDWQIWIRKGDSPLPEKVLYEINDDPARPKMSATLKWGTKIDFSDDIFAFKAPKGSQKIKVNPARKPEEK